MGRDGQPLDGAPDDRVSRSTVLVRDLSTFYLAVVACLTAWVLVPAVGLGWQPVVITSGSMGPFMQAGDVVLVDSSPPFDLGRGDVITFEDASRRDELVTHRIVDLDEDGSYITRGDANRSADSLEVDPDAVVGAGRILVPAAGLPAAWLADGPVRLVLWIALTVAAILMATARPLLPDPLEDHPGAAGFVLFVARAARPTRVRVLRATMATVAMIGCAAALYASASAAFADTTSSTGNSFLAAASFAYADVIAADSPFAHWRFGESTGSTAADEYATHDSTYTGGVTLAATGLIADPDTAVDFGGASGYVAVPNHTAINTGGPYAERTVEMWIEADDVTTRQVLFAEGGASRGLNLYVESGLLRWGGWNFNSDGPSSPWSYTEATASVSVNTTYHVAAVFDQAGDRLELFVDGVSAGSTSGIGLLYGHSGAIGIGAMNSGAYFHDGSGSGNGNYFDGVIDEVAIYDTALAADRIARHHRAG